MAWAGGVAAGAFLGWQAVQRQRTQQKQPKTAGGHIVIVGGGFGGWDAAVRCARLLPDNGQNMITVIDERDHMLFTPMLTEVAGGDVQSEHITNPMKRLPSRVHFIQGRVESIDLHLRTVALQGKPEEPIVADQLVIALGSSANFHHIPGVEDHAITMKSKEDAEHAWRRALAMLKNTETETDPAKRAPQLTFLVAGGGYTGVETIAALNHLLRDQAARMNHPGRDQIQTILVEPLDRLMNEVTPDLASYSQKELEKSGVRVILKCGIKSATPDSVELENGEVIPCSTLIWTAGIQPNTLVQKLDAPKGKQHGLAVDGCLAVPGRPGVWAIGDCAEIPSSEGKTYAPTAQNATREGVHVANNIARVLRGQAPKIFEYVPIGELAVVGKQTGVARIYGHNFSGFPAWLMWRAIYLAKLPGVRRRTQVFGDWLLNVVWKQHSAAQS